MGPGPGEGGKVFNTDEQAHYASLLHLCPTPDPGPPNLTGIDNSVTYEQSSGCTIP